MMWSLFQPEDSGSMFLQTSEIFTKLHHVLSQTTVFIIVIAVRTSNLTLVYNENTHTVIPQDVMGEKSNECGITAVAGRF